MDSFNSRICQALDTTLNTSFESIASMPQIQNSPAICVVNDNIYLLGGTNISAKQVQKYCSTTNTWSTETELKSDISRKNPCLVYGNEIYIYDDKSGKLLEKYPITRH